MGCESTEYLIRDKKRLALRHASVMSVLRQMIDDEQKQISSIKRAQREIAEIIVDAKSDEESKGYVDLSRRSRLKGIEESAVVAETYIAESARRIEYAERLIRAISSDYMEMEYKKGT